jgi:HTH-type transcriptional regulator/antitoxin HigA
MAPDSVQQAEWSPKWAIHPGEILEEYLEARGLTQAEFARRADLTPKLVSTIIAGKNSVSAHTAIAIERVLGTKAYIWTGLQSEWDLYQSRAALREVVTEPAVIDWIDQFPIKELRLRGVLPTTNDVVSTYDGLLKFFGVGSAEGYRSRFERLAVQYRHSATHRSDPACLHAWLQLGEQEARNITLAPYNADRFRAALRTIKAFTREQPSIFYPKLVSECCSAGVAVLAVKPLPKTRLSGAARWLPSGNGAIQLSLRHKTNDHFWFSFFHEAAHILLHKRDVVFADDEGAGGDGVEEEADEFAEDALVGRERFELFCRTRPKSRVEVRGFADRTGVHPGIVVGMLQHHRCIPWSHMNDLKDRFEWADEN